MEEKICPMRFAAPGQPVVKCYGNSCAWWVERPWPNGSIEAACALVHTAQMVRVVAETGMK